jgi:hypothetical protein
MRVARWIQVGLGMAFAAVAVCPAQTTLYVNPECGFDCYDGLSPIGVCDPCAVPPPPVPPRDRCGP